MSRHHLPNLVPHLTGDRIGKLPILILYLTDGCNSRCVTCNIWRSPRRSMPPALIDALIAQIQVDVAAGRLYLDPAAAKPTAP